MKTFSLFFMFLSIITFRACGEEEIHPDVELSLSPVFSADTLFLTPVVTYTGENPAIFYYENGIARIERVESDGNDGESIYVYEEQEDIVANTRSVLNEEDQRQGETIELEVEPGSYDVHLIAEYSLEEDVDVEDIPTDKYFHKLVQTIEVRK